MPATRWRTLEGHVEASGKNTRTVDGGNSRLHPPDYFRRERRRGAAAVTTARRACPAAKAAAPIAVPAAPTAPRLLAPAPAARKPEPRIEEDPDVLELTDVVESAPQEDFRKFETADVMFREFRAANARARAKIHPAGGGVRDDQLLSQHTSTAVSSAFGALTSSMFSGDSSHGRPACQRNAEADAKDLARRQPAESRRAPRARRDRARVARALIHSSLSFRGAPLGASPESRCADLCIWIPDSLAMQVGYSRLAVIFRSRASPTSAGFGNDDTGTQDFASETSTGFSR